jgi:hypothetical protein
MKKLIAVIFVLFCISLAAGEQTIRLVKISLPDHSEVYKLRKFDITIIDAGKNFAKALVNDKEIAELRTEGYLVEILIEDYKAYKDEIFQRGFYHTYDQVYLVLDSFATNYPSICRLDTIGYSVQGRAIWAMRVTDNPGIEENEPEIRLPANMHGDEHISTEVTLYFLRYLVTNYASNTQVQNLVNNREIWVLPTINPDGKVANTRRNANNVDLNRDYGYFWGAEGNSPGPSSQIENKLMMRHLEENNVSLEYNYHSVSQYVNYPWDYHDADPPDSQHIIDISQIYASAANLTIINGYDWYQITGGLQDFSIGTNGVLAATIETLEPSGSSQIDQICYENRDALMDVCDRAGWGIEGVVKDSLTNSPLYARVEFMNPDRIDVYTDPNHGDFHKMIAPGTYDIRLSANGYAPKTVNNVTVPDTGSVLIGDVLLASDSTYLYAFKSVLCRYRNHAEQLNKTRPRAALGPQDGLFFSLGQNGFVILDMGTDTPIHNSAGDDFTVYEGDDGTNEGYEVLASDDWDGPWSSCGTATGTASFDLSTAGLSEARYIRINDDGSSSSGQYAGFDVDAIQGTPPINAPHLLVTDYLILDGNNGIWEPGETADFVVTLHNSGLISADNTQGKLKTNDVYITISDSLGFYGDILPDSEKTNTADPFTIAASSLTPVGHTANFKLIVTADGYLDTFDIDIIVGKKHYYIWNPDPTPTPGADCHTMLGTLGYSGDYGTTLAPDLTLYQAVLVFVGIYSNNYVIGASSAEAAALVDFLQNQDGRMYLEGGDVWYYDPLYQGGYDFGSLFGIDATADGSGNGGPFAGQASTFTTGMSFAYGGENSYIDHISPTGTGFLIFRDTDNAYDAGVANDAGTYRTCGLSFELGGLVDATPPSTREVLLDSIMKFFGIVINPGIEEEGGFASLPLKTLLGITYPNPFKQMTAIRYQIAESDKAKDISLKVYDAAGRLVRTVIKGKCEPGYYTQVWDSRDDLGRKVPAGVYFVRFQTDGYQKTKKAILLR